MQALVFLSPDRVFDGFNLISNFKPILAPWIDVSHYSFFSIGFVLLFMKTLFLRILPQTNYKKYFQLKIAAFLYFLKKKRILSQTNPIVNYF